MSADGASRCELWLIRHGETEWSASGRHTGRTDLPLTEKGREQAELLGRRLKAQTFSFVLTSPLQRAKDTCLLAGLGDHAEVSADLSEWDYGSYEGRTTAELRAESPKWEIWTAPGVGETLAQVSERAERAIALTVSHPGKVAVFAHGHLLRILAARWLDFPALHARRLWLDTASLSILGYERDHRVIRLWNDVSHLGPGV
jgi:broad specificity phosphatase PhoE